jgi:tetratricopeptide (TPR) repeat protein
MPSMLRLKLLVVLLLAAASALLFWPALSHDFVFDDQHSLDKPLVVRGLTREGVTWALKNTEWAMYAPLTVLSVMTDFQLYGKSPRGHHLTSVLVHAASGALLFLVLDALTGAIWRSAAVAILFALHPLHVEPVAWISGRGDLLAGLFFILTLLAWASYLRQPGWPRSLLAVCLFFLGMMSKVIIMTLPFALLLFDYWPLGRLGRPETGQLGGGGSTQRRPQRIGPKTALLIEKTWFLLLTMAMVIVTLLLLRGAVRVSTEQYPLPARVATSLVSYATYLVKAVWPVDLVAFYPHTWGAYPWWRPFGSAVLLFGVTVGAVLLARRLPYLIVGWLWFLGTLFPVIGLYQAREYLMADRYAYLPLIGLFIVAVWGFSDLVRNRRWNIAACTTAMALVVAAYLPLSRAQIAYWRDGVTLFEHALDVTPGNAFAHFSLGGEYLARGEPRRARVHLSEAVRIRPTDAKARGSLGLALVQGGELAAGLAEYREALRINPRLAEVRINLGAALDNLQRPAEAEAEYREALKLQPDQVVGHMNLANLLSEHGRVEEALAHYAEALRIKPDYADAYANRGVTLTQIGKRAEAVADYRKALSLAPNNALARRGLGLR